MRSSIYWLFSARELAIPQIPKFSLLLAAKHPKFLFTNASPTFALNTNVHATHTPPPLRRPPSQACTLLRASPRQPGALSRAATHLPASLPVLTMLHRSILFSVYVIASTLFLNRLTLCFLCQNMFTTLWMWRQEYQHHEQLPLAFNGTWPSWNSDLDNRPW